MKGIFKNIFVDPNPDNPAEYDLQIATSAKRYLAFMIDYTWIMLALAGIYPLFLPDNWDLATSKDILVHLIPVYGIGIALVLLRDSFRGQSIGKVFLNLYVSNLDKEMTLASQGQRIKRNLTLVILPVEVFAMLFDKYCRRYGDKWAKTLVIDMQKPPKVRRITHKALGGMTVICTLWSLYVYTQPVSIKKASHYQLALAAVKDSAVVAEEVGEVRDVGYWPSVQYAFDHSTYGLDVIGSNGKVKAEVVLDLVGEKPKLLEVRLIKD